MHPLYHHLPILEVLIPFFASPLCVLIGRKDVSWFIAVLASFCSLMVAFGLLILVMGGTSISYHIGGWAPPYGIEYVVDSTNALFLVLVSGIGTIVLFYSKNHLKNEVEESKHTLFYTCYLLCLTGLLGGLITGDIFNVFVFLEISSLSTYVLVAMGAKKDKRALSAAFNYLILGTVGATFFVIGVGFLYMATGSLNMADIWQRSVDLESNRTIKSAYAFIVIGMGLKVAMFPLHLWLPNSYTYAPSVVTAFLAATATKVSLYVLIRFTFSVFHYEFGFIKEILQFLILPLAIASMFIMSSIAIFQKDVRKMFAYSSVGQVGYMLLGICFYSTGGLTATFVTLFNHGITKGTLFMTLGLISFRSGGSFLSNISGAGRKYPWTCLAFLIGAFSLVGIPGTAGFISKWLLIEAALEKGLLLVAFLIVCSSLLTIIYVWIVTEKLYFGVPSRLTNDSEISFLSLISVWLLAASCLYFGLNTDLTFGVAEVAANGLYSK